MATIPEVQRRSNAAENRAFKRANGGLGLPEQAQLAKQLADYTQGAGPQILDVIGMAMK